MLALAGAVFFLVLWALAGRRPLRFRMRTAATMLLACLVTLSPWLIGMAHADDYRPLVLRAGMHLPAAPGSNPPLWQGSGTNLLQAKLAGMADRPVWTIQYMIHILADPALVILGACAVGHALRRTLLGEIRASLRALWEGWKRIALKIAVAQTAILLFLLFFLVLGPIGLLMRLFRQDPMQAPREPGSFWNLRERTRERMEECGRQF